MPKIETRAVRYIGRRASFTDHLYGSGLDFDQRQVRSVPVELARQFLRHADLFEQAEAVDGDDTADLLKPVEDKAQEAIRKEMDLADLHRSIDEMDFATLQEFATRYGVNIPKSKGLERGREEIHARIDQLGAV